MPTINTSRDHKPTPEEIHEYLAGKRNRKQYIVCIEYPDDQYCSMDFEGIAWLGYKRIELKPSKSVDRIILNWRL